ncbi:MAG TPA: helix-turn-helix domain-containing protein [Pseudonocardiaceae bacterium]
MSHDSAHTSHIDARPPLQSQQLATLMRSALPGLVEQITNEIRRAIPEYARLADGPGGYALRSRIGRAAGLFVDLVDNPATYRGRLGETCRRFGREEATDGRSLDNLLAAYHVGARVSWRWIMRLGKRHNLSSPVMSRLAEMLFNYVDELSTLSSHGYHDAEPRFRGSGTELRRRLLRVILDLPDTPARAVAELARAAGWQVPEQVVSIAIDPGADLVPALSFGPDTLADVHDPAPHVLVPAPLEAWRAQQLAARLGAVVSVGPAVPVAGAASSLRWARQGLRLVREGVITDAPVVFCADHLTTLWLLSDEELLEQVGMRKLAVLDHFPDRQRLRLANTLFAWLRTNGNIKEIAEKLGVHPQTVRYRMRQLQEALGDQLHDPDARFEMEASLRAAELRAEARELLFH